MTPNRVGLVSKESSIPGSVLGPSCIEETAGSHPLAAAKAKAMTTLGTDLESDPKDETSKSCSGKELPAWRK